MMKNKVATIAGPFIQIITMQNTPLRGPVAQHHLHIVNNSWIGWSEGRIDQIGQYKDLLEYYSDFVLNINEISEPSVLLPGWIDCHTHICYGGHRIEDYSKRLEGKTYLQIAKEGGGINRSVKDTRSAADSVLLESLMRRLAEMGQGGVTTVEVKSGYGLSVQDELRMLRIIHEADSISSQNIIPTCLAAHMKPFDFHGNNIDYLNKISNQLLPQVQTENLASRVDIFIEETAFRPQESLEFLMSAKAMGFDLTIHGDQFTTGGSEIAIQVKALSVDHLEASGDNEIRMLAKSNTVAVVLPGASLGLGMPFAPMRKLLDQGCCVAIASDWNPGSAPMGHLLTMASIMSAYEKVSIPEVIAGITVRAARALKLSDRGIIEKDKRADLVSFPTHDYREIFYRQGRINPSDIWIGGVKSEMIN
ncbi:MAG TPA: imidazolonepropionase [Saprospiraceae bacterium]|nr:imidazolonepropionase [Saprospiraceae bacterium]